MTFSHLSLEYIKLPVEVVINGVAYDPHLDAVVLAFPVRGVDPVALDWKTGSWELGSDGIWMARCLVGPGGTVTLTAGTYDAWVKITDSPEIPVRKCGVVEVT